MPTMYNDLAAYDRLLNRLYDTPFQPDAWRATLGEICAVFSASKAVIYTYRHGPADGGFAITHELAQEQLEAWAQISPAEDPYVRAISHDQIVDGAVWEGTTVVPHERLIESRMYREIWKPLGIEHICIGIVFDGTDGHKLPTSISLFRGPEAETFGAAEVEALGRLVVHLSRAMGVMFHLRDADRRLASSYAALDRLTAGVALLGADGRLRHANAAARALFRQGDCFVLEADAGGAERLVLSPHVRGMQQRFEAAMSNALAPIARDAEHFSNGLVITDSAGKPVCVMHAAPVGATSTATMGDDGARVIVFFYSLNDAPKLNQSVLRQIFGLTPAEAKAANAVLEGGSVREAAQRLAISENTLKTQLRAVYVKTNTNRQTDLLKLLLALISN